MCLIIHSPAGHDISRKVIKSAMSINSDGVGIMFGGEVEKYLNSPVEEIATRTLELCDTEFAIHFRMKTHGDVNLDNVHPFKLPNDGGFLMHNGILPCGNSADPSKPDTWHYIRLHLSNGGINWSNVALDRGNKFVVMDKKGKFIIVNRETGVDYAGAWYSNTYAWDYPDKVHFTRGYSGRRHLTDAVVSLLENAELSGLVSLPYSAEYMDDATLAMYVTELEEAML